MSSGRHQQAIRRHFVPIWSRAASDEYQEAPGTVVSMVTRVALKGPVTCAIGVPEALTISQPSQPYTSRVKGPEK
jgi:hypothetical protein